MNRSYNWIPANQQDLRYKSVSSLYQITDVTRSKHYFDDCKTFMSLIDGFCIIFS